MRIASTVLTASILALCAITMPVGRIAAADRSSDGEAAFRALYKELVETNTTHSNGSCTVAAERMAARLKTAGYADADLHLFGEPEHPREGGLVAQLKGSDGRRKAILLLAHLDVVEASRADWGRDPFALIEEGGYFYGRGAADDKSMAAIFTDLMIRYKQEGYRPKRGIRLALTCGEETSGAFNGARYLATERKEWIDAEFAINEGGSGELDAAGKPVMFAVEAAEKVYQDFELVTTSPGGHSSRPGPDNAIYVMATALERVGRFTFPLQLSDVTRAYFAKTAARVGGDARAAMLALLKEPGDARANALLSADRQWNSTLRTTCVATMIQGGHAMNALPQHVAANVNCRIFPGNKIETVRDTLVAAIADPQVAVSIKDPRSPATPAPPLSLRVMQPIEAVAAELFPGLPVMPVMTTGATDGIYVTAAGIPTYGFSGMFIDPDFGHIHGLNERIRVQSLLDGRKFQYRLIKRYAEQP